MQVFVRGIGVRLGLLLAVIAGLLALGTPSFKAAESLPAEVSDEAFWKMVVDMSEPDGSFQFENFLSNELGYQYVIPRLLQITRPGGVYMGVAPEQNFTYIAAMKPKMAFIIDIRRQNMIELLMYKSFFEMSETRADFISKLFARKRPGWERCAIRQRVRWISRFEPHDCCLTNPSGSGVSRIPISHYATLPHPIQ